MFLLMELLKSSSMLHDCVPVALQRIMLKHVNSTSMLSCCVFVAGAVEVQ